MNHRRKSTSTTTPTATANTTTTMDATRKRISKMEQDREERRKSMLQRKEARKQEQLKNIAAGNPGDVDFIGMVDEWRHKKASTYQPPPSTPTTSTTTTGTKSKICIAIRKRPMSDKERGKLDHDSVSCFPPQVTIHSAKFKVDGITKYLTHNSFQFDHAFGEDSTTEDIYVRTTLPLVDHVVALQGRATVFCYGQTGSGKTFTMNGIQHILAHDLYGQLAEAPESLEITVAFFELYGGFIQDLLHERQRCKLLEDGKGEVNITGLHEVPADTPEDFLRIIEEGHSLRTTHTTEANDTSSRSHAICQVFLRKDGKLVGKLSLVDLAGSERGSDTKSHNSQRRAESADINTSLLSLKECIRALGQKSSHVPYRGSKLTLILKDCFSSNSKTTMIATVSPGASSTDHSLNTLRYADRIKEQRTTPGTSKRSRQSTGTGIKANTNKAARAVQPPSRERLERILGAAAAEAVVTANADTPMESPTIDMQETIVEVDEPEESVLLTESPARPTTSSRHNRSIKPMRKKINRIPAEEKLPDKAELEEEMRRTVQGVFQLEEALLNQHMRNIQENADMLNNEGKLLQLVQEDGVSDDEVNEYALQLAECLDRKELLIYKLQQKLMDFKKELAKEQELAQQVRTLSQY